MRTLRSGDGILELGQRWRFDLGTLTLAQHSGDLSTMATLFKLISLLSHYYTH